jgi:hypothetical protein
MPTPAEPPSPRCQPWRVTATQESFALVDPANQGSEAGLHAVRGAEAWGQGGRDVHWEAAWRKKRGCKSESRVCGVASARLSPVLPHTRDDVACIKISSA